MKTTKITFAQITWRQCLSHLKICPGTEVKSKYDICGSSWISSIKTFHCLDSLESKKPELPVKKIFLGVYLTHWLQLSAVLLLLWRWFLSWWMSVLICLLWTWPLHISKRMLFVPRWENIFIQKKVNILIYFRKTNVYQAWLGTLQPRIYIYWPGIRNSL